MMIDKLKGVVIWIGKEPGQGRLQISTKVNGQFKTAFIGHPGLVPSSVSRCKPTEGVAHCKIEIKDSGNMLLTNLKAQNVTFVNGDEIMSKRVDANSQVALGKDRFAINISQILSVVTKMLEVIDSGSHGGGSAHVNGGSKVITGGGGKEPIYSIKHLEYVWNDYNENLKKIRKRQRKLGLMSSIPMGFTMLGGCIVAFVPEIRPIAGAFTAVAFALFLISIFLRANDKSIDEEEQLKKRLEDNYVCPNPKCHCFVGNQSYNLLRKRKNCPICKCLWTEE